MLFRSIPGIAPLKAKSLRATKSTEDWFIFENGKIETPFYCAILNPDGSFVSLFDKELKRDWTKGEFNKLKIYSDTPGNYDAWDILPNYKDKEIDVLVAEPLFLNNADGECAEFKTVLKTEKSTWTMLIRFFKNSRGIEVENNVDWHEKHKLAKAEFGLNVLTRKALCDTSAGFIERDTQIGRAHV